MSLGKLQPTSGRILIAEPFLQDFYFRRSVVLLADHNEEGSFGLILNKPVESRLSDVMDEFTDFNPTLYLGGPVQTDALFFIHRLGDKVENSLKIAGNIRWGGNIDQIKELIHTNQISENDIRFFVGYSGWSPNQLDREMEEKAWVVTDKNVEKLMNTEPDQMWENALENMGSVFKQWVNFPADPTWN